MKAFTKKFRVLEDGTYRVAVKVISGSRLKDIRIGETPVEFGFVRSIDNGAIFLSDLILATRGDVLWFDMLSYTDTFNGATFRTFFSKVNSTIGFQDIVAEKNEEDADPGEGGGGSGGGDTPTPPDPPDDPVTVYGPELTPTSWYTGYTNVIPITSRSVVIPNEYLTRPGEYNIVICLAKPYFVESIQSKGYTQWDRSTLRTTPISISRQTLPRYYFNSVDYCVYNLPCEFVSEIVIQLGTEDDTAVFRGSAVLIKRQRALTAAAEYINRVLEGSISCKQYLGDWGDSVGEGISIYLSHNHTQRIVAVRADGDIAKETSTPDASTLRVIKYDKDGIYQDKKFTELGNVWPAKGSVVPIINRVVGTNATYDRWVSAEIYPSVTQYGTNMLYRAGGISKYNVDAKGNPVQIEIKNPDTGAIEKVKDPRGVTTTSYGYGLILPIGKVLASRRVKLSSNFDVSNSLQAWRNTTPSTLLNDASDDIKQSNSVFLVVEVVNSTKSKYYKSSTGKFTAPTSSQREGNLYFSPYAAGEDGINYASLSSSDDYSNYLLNRLVNDPDNPKKYLDIWERADRYYGYHRIFHNATAVTATSATFTDVSVAWFIHDGDPSHCYYFIRMSDIFGRGTNFNRDAAKRILAYPTPGQDVYISILDSSSPSYRIGSHAQTDDDIISLA